EHACLALQGTCLPCTPRNMLLCTPKNMLALHFKEHACLALQGTCLPCKEHASLHSKEQGLYIEA
ncbi:hypothetical protein Tco_0817872, partial [Tanacetum coccineum]